MMPLALGPLWPVRRALPDVEFEFFLFRSGWRGRARVDWSWFAASCRDEGL